MTRGLERNQGGLCVDIDGRWHDDMEWGEGEFSTSYPCWKDQHPSDEQDYLTGWTW